MRLGRLMIALTVALGWGASRASAQYSSLIKREQERLQRQTSLGLMKASWTAIATPEPKKIKRHDIVTVLISEISESSSEADFERETEGKINAELTDWIRTKDGKLFEHARIATQQPALKGTLKSELEKDAKKTRKDRMRDRIAASVVDVRPNGVLVLEASKRYSHNEEIVSLTLTGEVRQEDVLPNNTIMSEDVANLRIVKSTRGAVHGATKRGWLLWLIDVADPF